MDNAQAFSHRRRHVAGIGISLAMHAALLAWWQLAREAPLRDQTTPGAMVLKLLPAKPGKPPAPAQALRTPPLPSPRAASTPTEPSRASARAAAPAPAVPEAPPEQLAAEPAPAVAGDAPALPAPGSLLERARAAAGGADRAVRKENPTRGIVAPVVTAQMKLEKGIAAAADLVPNKWYEAPKVTEVLDPGGYGRRRYRVVGANGTYCVTYESNHAPDGLDTMRDGIKPKKTNCDPDWGPATTQKWN